MFQKTSGGRCHHAGKHSQIALFILTKFAMLFFIFSLAALVMAFGNHQRNNLCEDEANRIAKAVASTIAYTINSPLEDERKIYALEPSLSVGREDFERYVINITHRNTSFVIEVKPTAYAAGCSGGAYATHPKNMNVTMTISFELLSSTDIHHSEGGVEVMSLHPGSHPTSRRSFYLVVLKCGDKTGTHFPPPKYLFLQNCGNQNASMCFNYKDIKKDSSEHVCCMPGTTSLGEC